MTFNHFYSLAPEVLAMELPTYEQQEQTPHETETLRQQWVKQAQEEGGL